MKLETCDRAKESFFWEDETPFFAIYVAKDQIDHQNGVRVKLVTKKKQI